MSKVSVLIPARNERYLVQTVTDVFAKAVGDVEVIVVLDGPTKYPLPAPRPQLIFSHNSQSKGLRAAINTAAGMAKGKYLLKIDGHCALAPGYDQVLQQDYEANWVVVPRCYHQLDTRHWKPASNSQWTDYYFLSCPWKNVRYPSLFMMKDCGWSTRDQDKKEMLIDDEMTFIGSCWFMSTDHFHSKLGGLNTVAFGNFAENQEIGLKTWLGGGRVIVNKNTWYAHLQQKDPDRGYQLSRNAIFKSHVAIAKYFVNNQWPERMHDFAWLVEKFWPLPTRYDPARTQSYYWPENWKSYYSQNDSVTRLSQLAMKYGSDKCPQIHHFYTEYYSGIFKDKEQKVKKVLEIGVGYPECMTHSPNYQIGASLYMWQEYFPQAQIYGIDILPDLVFKDDRIETFLCNQTDKPALMQLIRQIGSDIDLVIDDGSHLPEDQVFTCLTLMPLLQSQVIYIIEDVRDKEITKYLKDYQTHVVRKSRMAGIYDRLIEVVNKT